MGDPERADRKQSRGRTARNNVCAAAPHWMTPHRPAQVGRLFASGSRDSLWRRSSAIRRGPWAPHKAARVSKARLTSDWSGAAGNYTR